MLYDVNTPEEYLNGLENDWRTEKLKEIRTLILEEIPQIQEQINYKMLGYNYKDDMIFHLNAQKAYVGLYVCDKSKVDPEGDLLAGIQ